MSYRIFGQDIEYNFLLDDVRSVEESPIRLLSGENIAPHPSWNRRSDQEDMGESLEAGSGLKEVTTSRKEEQEVRGLLTNFLKYYRHFIEVNRPYWLGRGEQPQNDHEF